jgi:hypothetical protein
LLNTSFYSPSHPLFLASSLTEVISLFSYYGYSSFTDYLPSLIDTYNHHDDQQAYPES